MTRLTLLSRRNCHLCDEARAVVRAVAAREGCEVTELDVDGDPELRAEYGDQVPVLLIDDEMHSFFRVDPAQLAAALRARTPG